MTQGNSDVKIDSFMQLIAKSRQKQLLTTRQLLQIQERRKHDIIRSYYHNGTFQFCAHDNTHAWSCCMNTHEYSQGCQLSVRNAASWQTQHF